MRRFIALLGSIRLATSLMVALAISTVFFSATPSFFSSWPFIGLSIVLMTSLLACTTRRLIDEFNKPRDERCHGSDILHLGLFILCSSALASFSLRFVTRQDLATGGSISLPTGETALLEYAIPGQSGLKAGILLSGHGSTRRIELVEGVHSDLDGGYRLSFEAYAMGQALVLESIEAGSHSETKQLRLSVGAVIEGVDASIRYVGPSGPGRAAIEIGGEMGSELREMGKGDEAAGLRIAGFAPQAFVRLRITRDPAYPVVLAGMTISVLGLSMMMLRRSKGEDVR